MSRASSNQITSVPVVTGVDRPMRQNRAVAKRGNGATRMPRPVFLGERLVDAIFAAVFVSIALAMCLIGIVNSPRISVLDEDTHIDYAWQIQHGNLPAKGDVISDEVLHDVICRGRTPMEYPWELSCGSEYAANPDNYGLTKGVNYNEFHPPLYYAFAAGIASITQAVAGVDFIVGARIASALLVAAGIGAVYLAVRVWRVGRMAAVAGTAILLSSLPLMYSGMIVSNDAINILAGAAAIWILGQVFVHRRFPFWRAGLMMLLIASSKVVSAVGLIVLGIIVGCWGLAQIIRRNWGQGAKAIAFSMTLAAPLLAAVYLWGRFQSGRGDPNATNPVDGVNTRPFAGTPIDEILANQFTMFEINRGFEHWAPLEIRGWGLVVAGVLASVLVVASAFVGVTAFKKSEPGLAAGGLLLLAMLITPVIVQGQALMSAGMVFPVVSTRYASCVLPVAALIWALVVHKRRWGSWAWLITGASAFLLFGTIARVDQFISL